MCRNNAGEFKAFGRTATRDVRRKSCNARESFREFDHASSQDLQVRAARSGLYSAPWAAGVKTNSIEEENTRDANKFALPPEPRRNIHEFT